MVDLSTIVKNKMEFIKRIQKSLVLEYVKTVNGAEGLNRDLEEFDFAWNAVEGLNHRYQYRRLERNPISKKTNGFHPNISRLDLYVGMDRTHV